jgi:hypothetical protein
MSIFYQGSPKTLQMYYKIIEEACREPLSLKICEKQVYRDLTKSELSNSGMTE